MDDDIRHSHALEAELIAPLTGAPFRKYRTAFKRFYRPVKQAVSLRLDADVIAWLKKDGDAYQMRVNQMLRERMLEDLKQHSTSSL